MVEFDFSSLSDQDLSQMLKDYGMTVGPINTATRKIYERKLHKLKTGEAAQTVPKYEPAPNDEDDSIDNEVQFKAPPPTPPQTSKQTPSQPLPSELGPSVVSPEPPQTRMRREPADSYTPLINSRPSLGSARKTTLSYDTHKSDSVPHQTPRKSKSSDQTQSGGLPMWVKLTALVAAVVLVYLIYTNMESNVASNIPKIPSKANV